jgi:dGTP triphosphohydrolase
MFERKGDKIKKADYPYYTEGARRLFKFSPVSEPYTGSRAQKAALRGLATRTIRKSVIATSVSPRGLTVEKDARRDVAILKELAWQFVIENPRMAAQQEGKRKIICELFRIFGDAASSQKTWKMFPPPFQEQLEFGEVSPARTTSDFIASLGEQRAVELFSEVSGMSFKPIVTGLPL